METCARVHVGVALLRRRALVVVASSWSPAEPSKTKGTKQKRKHGSRTRIDGVPQHFILVADTVETRTTAFTHRPPPPPRHIYCTRDSNLVRVCVSCKTQTAQATNWKLGKTALRQTENSGKQRCVPTPLPPHMRDSYSILVPGMHLDSDRSGNNLNRRGKKNAHHPSAISARLVRI